MTWTYSGNPAASALDQVRFTIGDTDTTDQQLSNAAEAIAAKLARESDSSKSVGDMSLSRSLSARSQKYYELAQRLTQQAANFDPPVPWVNPNALGPEFAVGQMDYLKTNPNETTI
jgi:adenosylmethionine-8-amino-7-oxononanoate aminotransferase